jgi:hypothetical protein
MPNSVPELTIVHVFRDQRFSRGGDTIVCVAPREVVVSVFGDGGLFGADGLSAAFGGWACFKNDETDQAYLGVWGARKASRFRERLRSAGTAIRISNEPPRGRLVVRAKN